ncbi:MAG: C39 family peptidase [Nanoarchaeota archaeon]|nr:C39 family peptidase [Nanoarchaeota archaeon]
MINIKPFKEKPGYCGPASLKMIASYYGIKKSEEELAKLCKCTPEKGTSAKNLIKAAKKIGLEGFIQNNSSISDIRKYVLKKKIPLIVDWFCEYDGHYTPVIDINAKNIYLADGCIGSVRTMNLDKFKRVWFDFLGGYLKSKDDLILRRMIVLYKKE